MPTVISWQRCRPGMAPRGTSCRARCSALPLSQTESALTLPERAGATQTRPGKAAATTSSHHGTHGARENPKQRTDRIERLRIEGLMTMGPKADSQVSEPQIARQLPPGRAIWKARPVTPMSFGGHHTRKRFGQHWLTDAAVLERIVAAAELQPGERVLEVGPGRGALTERLLATALAELHAVELDRDLVAGLRRQFAGDERFQLLEGDVLRLDLPPADKVVANIPYNITGPLLERLVGRLDRPLASPYRRLVLLVQQEVGERIRAVAGSSAFSALSVRLQLLAHCRSVCAVPPRCFQPPPKVMSEVIVLDPLPPSERLEPQLAGRLEGLLKRCFAARRKMLRNSLAGLWPEGELSERAERAGVSLRQRPQELSPQRWVELTRQLCPTAQSPRESSSPISDQTAHG